VGFAAVHQMGVGGFGHKIPNPFIIIYHLSMKVALHNTEFRLLFVHHFKYSACFIITIEDEIQKSPLQ
jgi:hypothetical protein